ncbi:MAG: helix-turn-helix domain-containing protein [Clostridia bacterium]|nr:helix-turn-helix domain-containing protein [Clostridia bacterium]
MRPYGRGILPQSQIYLYDTAEQAKRMFLYALCVGHYECGADYVVRRPNFDSYLLLYIKRGLGYYVNQDDRRVELPQGAFALINCYRSHEYGAIEPSEMYWIHFDGPTAKELCGAILKEGRFVPKNFDRCRNTLVELCDRTARSGPLEDAIVNRMIVNMLTEFLVTAEQRPSAGNEMIEDIRNYMLDNLDKNLSLDALAKRANLSPYHFARTFKRHVGLSPHDYLIHARLNLATFYLKSTDDPIKNIAYICGFSNESTFCTTFKNRLGLTPSKYRANLQSS